MPKIIDDEKIFDAVIQVIMQRGYASSTTKQMAGAAGVSEVTLFRKYGSKAQLVKMAIDSIVQKSAFETSTHYSGDLQADLLRVLQAYQSSVVLHGRFFLGILTGMSGNPELANSIVQPAALFHSISQLLVRYQAEGVLRQEPPLQSIAALLGPVIFAGMMRDNLPDSLYSPMNLRDHVEKYLQGRLENR